MQSFRSEIENPLVQKDIIDLERKIRLFREGKIAEEKFRSLRLARGVYGQRQQGVQMVRIKLPFGKVTTKQLLRIADISDEYATSNLHLTTRQDIQIHFVSLDRTPELWAKLEEDDITLREACGNTVRNITASPDAGINPDEPFDVSPYADAAFRYFLRNPICQEMGRKFKIAFSSSDADSGLAYMHDMGFIPKVREVNGEEERGFRVVVGGGLGAQPVLAHLVHEFLPEDQLIPFIESIIRVFDRYGERNNRNKARMKYLIAKIGLEEFLRLVAEEKTALKVKSFKIDRFAVAAPVLPEKLELPAYEIQNQLKYEVWSKTNVAPQKQPGYYSVGVRIQIGDIKTDKARLFADLVKKYAADEVRITVNQSFLLKFVREEALPVLFSELDKLGLAEPGFESVADITACPGTDTCNLAISNSTDVTRVLESVITEEFPDFIYEKDFKIKISGCMNSCGQHGMAHLGFHGSSLKSGKNVLPALQVLLGGGTLGNGEGRVAQKVIKVPSKRGPEVIRYILGDYQANGQEGENFIAYFDRQGKDYFYQLLKPLADLTTLATEDFVDWGHEGEQFATAIGVGECAGVMIDLVATLLFESDEKFGWSTEALAEKRYADAIYHSYNVLVSSAKALLLDKGVSCNTQAGVIADFDKYYVQEGVFSFEPDFSTTVLQINKNEPSEEFALRYNAIAQDFLEKAKVFREERVDAFTAK